MKIAHVGPPLARTGGPAGFMLQLEATFAAAGAERHSIVFPPKAPPPTPPRQTALARLRDMAGRTKRRVTGQPHQLRPAIDDCRECHGLIERYRDQTFTDTLTAASPSLAAARDADLLIAHEHVVAERLLETRRPGQQVWLFAHSPMPSGLYLMWNWGLPELAWEEVAAFPDVQAWIDRELAVWREVDRVITPTSDALDELARVDSRFRSAGRMAYVLTGASAAPTGAPRKKADIRKAWRLPLDQPVGLYLGNTLPYRGFDRLLAGLDRLVDTRALPGTIAVAGPPPASVPAHDRIRALGPVSAVAELMSAVDFFVNTNRFSLFDLSIIEAAEASLPLLLHMTGGNRAFARLGAGHVAVGDLGAASVARGLEELFAMPPADRSAVGARSRACYDAHLTPAHAARSHVALYDDALGAVPA